MNIRERLVGAVMAVILTASLLACVTGDAIAGTAKWQEEVLLHDGQTIVVERSQTRGGYVTIDSRTRQILEEEWAFPVPGSAQKLFWKNDFRNPPQGQSLMLVLVGFVNGSAYLAASPAGCIAYNHWGRPNPPYVFFKHDGMAWQRIALAEFPSELKAANVVVGGRDNQEKQYGAKLSVTEVSEGNTRLEPHHRAIVREPIAEGDGSWRCEELVYYKGGWISPGDSIGKRMMDRMSKPNTTVEKINSNKEEGH